MRTFFEKLDRSLSYKDGDLRSFDGETVVSGKELEDPKKSIKRITEFIYSALYAGTYSPAGNGRGTVITIETDNEFIERLSAIHNGKRQLSENWLIKEIIDENVLKVSRNEITLTINRKVHQPENEQAKAPEAGTMTSIFFSCHYPNISAGFYAFKSEEGELNPDDGILRMYFNLRFEHAVDFTGGLLDIAYKQKIVFDYKIFKTLRTQSRPDCAVLYFRAEDFETVKETIFPFLSLNAGMFNDEVSSFHYPLFKGVGLAEEPAVKEGHESYGLNRCRLIAEVVYNSLDELEKNGHIPYERFESHFQKNGIDIHRIYLNLISPLRTLLSTGVNNQT